VQCCIDEGEQDERAGRVIPHEQVMRELRDRWIRRNAPDASSGRDSRGGS
jgi:predicted transcriptional regulator